MSVKNKSGRQPQLFAVGLVHRKEMNRYQAFAWGARTCSGIIISAAAMKLLQRLTELVEDELSKRRETP